MVCTPPHKVQTAQYPGIRVDANLALRGFER